MALKPSRGRLDRQQRDVPSGPVLETAKDRQRADAEEQARRGKSKAGAPGPADVAQPLFHRPTKRLEAVIQPQDLAG